MVSGLVSTGGLTALAAKLVHGRKKAKNNSAPETKAKGK
jgi:hypothetical protein